MAGRPAGVDELRRALDVDTHDAPSYKRTGIELTEAQACTVRAIIDSVLPGAEVWVFGSRATGMRARSPISTCC